MKLIKIEAHGFKSFADPVNLRFDGGVMAIIGPNGSGKSNINDAIKWVLGEQSYKELRGKSMEDVIFAGSKTAKAMDKASVTLTFDNRERLSSFDSDYISITREITRGKAGNKYYINGKENLHKNIKQLAMETGIGKSSLAIISQGKVSEIAESSDEQRREIFEEAAGISKFKSQKIESERRLERTEIELDKVTIKLNELKKRKETLEPRAQKAIKYKEKSAELKNVEIQFLAADIERLINEIETLTEEVSGAKENLAQLDDNIEKYDAKKSILKQETKEISQQLDKLRSQLKITTDKSNSLAVSAEKIKAQNELLLSGSYTTDKEKIAEAAYKKAKSLEIQIKTYKESLAADIQTYNDQKELEKIKADEEIQLGGKLRELENKVHQVKSQLNNLLKEQSNNTHLERGVKTIVENKNNFKGYIGLVSELFKINPEYLVALDTILSSSSQNIVFEDENSIAQAINFLKKNKGGRAIFIPLASIKGRFINDAFAYGLMNVKGFLGYAKDFVEVLAEHEILRDFLLGNIIIASNIDRANEISRLVERRYMVVTKDGDVVRPGGVIVGGETRDVAKNLNIGLEINKLKEWLQKAEPALLVQQNNYQKLREEVRQLNTYTNSLNVELEKSKVKIAQLEKELSDCKLQYGQVEGVEVGKEEDLLVSLSEQIAKFENQIKNLNVDIKFAEKKYQEHETDLEEIDKILTKFNNDRRKLDTTFGHKLTALDKNKDKLEEEQIRLSQHYELTLEFAKENYPLTMDLQLASNVVKELRKEINELGNVDLTSIEEYEQVKEEFDTTSATYEEVKSAVIQLKKDIEELEHIMIDKFVGVLNDVNKNFGLVFKKLFGGGSASAVLIEPDQPLTSGIQIKVQPPGKTIKNLNLLSGGEKSLTAISLLFAILQARPLPLCILDEAESALDESNVGRYADYLQELKHKTQFLVITHRHGTMIKADGIIGATMQNRGVTTFLSMDIKDAEKWVDKEEKNQTAQGATDAI